MKPPRHWSMVPVGAALLLALVVPSAYARSAYITSIGGVTAIDTATNQATEVPDAGKLIKVGTEPVGIAISPDGKRAYVANEGGGVSVIDTATNQAIEAPDGGKPDQGRRRTLRDRDQPRRQARLRR